MRDSGGTATANEIYGNSRAAKPYLQRLNRRLALRTLLETRSDPVRPMGRRANDG